MAILINTADCPLNFNFMENLNANFAEFKANYQTAVESGQYNGEDDDPAEFLAMWEILKTSNDLMDFLSHGVSLPEICFNYAEFVIGDRWEVAEFLILQSPKYACLYAMFVIQDRWEAAEGIIATNPYNQDQYMAFNLFEASQAITPESPTYPVWIAPHQLVIA